MQLPALKPVEQGITNQLPAAQLPATQHPIVNTSTRVESDNAFIIWIMLGTLLLMGVVVITVMIYNK